MIVYTLTAVLTLKIANACPPQSSGSCYSGTATLSTSYSGGIVSRRCAETLNREWCAVSYYPYSNTASFGCANEFQIPFGSATCGDGPGFINQQGCAMANTPSGPCYFCCCRGGSCNHPALFAREASRLTLPQNGAQGTFVSNNHRWNALATTIMTVIHLTLFMLT